MISLHEISIAYKKAHYVIEKLKIDFPPGLIHGIVGLNGAGKTSLLRTIAGQLKAVHGFLDYGIPGKPGKLVALMETDPFFYSYTTGREHLQLFGSKDFDTDRWNALFHIPLDEVIEHYSTGMKKKLALMALLKQNKPIMILDEPFNGLDMESSSVLKQLLLQFVPNKTIFISSHILPTLTDVCDQIHYLETGKLISTTSRENFSDLTTFLESHLQSKYKLLIDQLLT